MRVLGLEARQQAALCEVHHTTRISDPAPLAYGIVLNERKLKLTSEGKDERS